MPTQNQAPFLYTHLYNNTNHITFNHPQTIENPHICMYVHTICIRSSLVSFFFPFFIFAIFSEANVPSSLMYTYTYYILYTLKWAWLDINKGTTFSQMAHCRYINMLRSVYGSSMYVCIQIKYVCFYAILWIWNVHFTHIFMRWKTVVWRDIPIFSLYPIHKILCHHHLFNQTNPPSASSFSSYSSSFFIYVYPFIINIHTIPYTYIYILLQIYE